MRFALVYVVLVGIPLLVLGLVLKLGAKLQPPLSVGGAWDLAVEQQAALEVVQSGPVLELLWGEVAGRGRLVGTELDGALGEWTLRAHRTEDARLIGTLSRADASPVISFVATRARRTRGQGKGH